jgi:hypothetical protein
MNPKNPQDNPHWMDEAIKRLEEHLKVLRQIPTPDIVSGVHVEEKTHILTATEFDVNAATDALKTIIRTFKESFYICDWKDLKKVSVVIIGLTVSESWNETLRTHALYFGEGKFDVVAVPNVEGVDLIEGIVAFTRDFTYMREDREKRGTGEMEEVKVYNVFTQYQTLERPIRSPSDDLRSSWSILDEIKEDMKFHFPQPRLVIIHPELNVWVQKKEEE